MITRVIIGLVLAALAVIGWIIMIIKEIVKRG